jgi:hypothetical protein
MSQFWALLAIMATAVPAIIAVVNRLKALPWARGAPSWAWFVASFVLAAAAVAFYVYGAGYELARVAAVIVLVGGAAAGIYDISSPTLAPGEPVKLAKVSGVSRK